MGSIKKGREGYSRPVRLLLWLKTLLSGKFWLFQFSTWVHLKLSHFYFYQMKNWAYFLIGFGIEIYAILLNPDKKKKQ